MIFDKDDQLVQEFVTAAANIRMSSFGISLHSFFEAKGIAVEKYFFGFPFEVQLAFDFVNSLFSCCDSESSGFKVLVCFNSCLLTCSYLHMESSLQMLTNI